MPSLGLAYDKYETAVDSPTSDLNGSAKKATPVLQSFDARTCSVDDLVNAMKLAGGVILRNAVSFEHLDQVEKDLRPYLDADGEWDGDFFPKESRRAHSLMGNSPTFAEHLAMHPLYQATCNKFLTTKNWFWCGNNKTYAKSMPQLMNTAGFLIGPGAHAQPLHRDDWTYHVVAKKVDQYPEDLQRDVGIGWFVAAKDATKANGATRFIPGSHLWEHERAPDESLCVQAELKRGDAFIMFASCYHGGGANTTTDEERLLFTCFMSRGWLRQEENQYLAVSLETAKKLPVEVQKLIGYSLSEPFLGWVNAGDPRKFLDPSLGNNVDLVSKTEASD